MLLSAFRRDDKYHIRRRKIEQKDLITLCTLLLQKDGANGERGKKEKSVDHIRSSLIWKSDIYSVKVGAINGGRPVFGQLQIRSSSTIWDFLK